MYPHIYKVYKEVCDEYVTRELFNHSQESPEETINDIKNNKIAIYTAFTGDYDTLKDPEFIDENCDYICFTDNPNLTSDIWKIIPMEHSILDNNRKAKQYKVLPHKYLKEYKYSFWMDGSFKIKGSIREYIYKFIKASSPMLCVVHTERDSIYDEYERSLFQPRYPKVIMKAQVDSYRERGFPDNYGMGVMGVIFRNHHDKNVIQVMEDWWDEIIKFTNQDQLSFAYVCWKNDFHPSVGKVYYWDNEFWAKGGGEYHHKVVHNIPINSDNLIDELSLKIKDLDAKDTVELSKEELYLLINDVKALKGYKKDFNQHIKSRKKTYNGLVNSKSFKYTKNLRKIMHSFKK